MSDVTSEVPAGVPVLDEQRIAWWRDHAGLLATVGYVLLIVVGLIYEALLLLRFRVNILYYAQASDFLLVPFREPLVTIVAILPIPLWMLYMRFSYWLGKRFPSKRFKEADHPVLYRRLRLVLYISGMALWSFAATIHYAKHVSQEILDGERRVVRLDLGTGGSVSGPIIAATSQWMFVWDGTTKHTRIVPVGNVAQITVYRTARKEPPKPVAVPPVAVPR
jgi:hypothetical protein